MHGHRRPPAGIRTWLDTVDDDETQLIGDVRVTTPARTAFDLACRNPVGKAVVAIDALARATGLQTADAQRIVDRYNGHRNIRRARHALTLVDAGAESPRETWLRLLVIEAGYPPPQTQIPVYGPYGELVGVVDMGWEDRKIALEYEGMQHWNDPQQFQRDVERYETLPELGWIPIRVTAGNTRGGILTRLATAWAHRTCSEGEKIAKIPPSEHIRRQEGARKAD